MIMYGGQTREFAIDAVDFNRNGVIDIRDFKVFNVTYTVSLDINISGDIISSDSPWVVSLDVPIPPDLGDNLRKLIIITTTCNIRFPTFHIFIHRLAVLHYIQSGGKIRDYLIPVLTH